MVKNQAGQSVAEAVLLTAVIAATALLVSSQFQEQNILANLVERPWKSLDGMVKNGVWGPSDRTNRSHHLARHRWRSIRGESR